MKGGLAAAMVAAAAVRRAGVPLAGRLMVAALVDEEDAMSGAKHFAGTPLGRAVSAAIICEPEQNELCLEQKGVLWARVTVHGRMAHGAMPYAGVNPIAAAGTAPRAPASARAPSPAGRPAEPVPRRAPRHADGRPGARWATSPRTT